MVTDNFESGDIFTSYSFIESVGVQAGCLKNFVCSIHLLESIVPRDEGLIHIVVPR